MRAMLRPVLGLALAAALAGCSHGASSVAPVNQSLPQQNQSIVAHHVPYFGQVAGNAAQVCGAARPGEARCHAWIRTDIVNPNGEPGYHPADLISAYKIKSTGGTGQTVAVVDAYNDPNAESDLAVYRSTFGLPACGSSTGCFQQLNQYGKKSPLPANDTTGWSEEESLDVDMVSAACPNCKIILIEGNGATFSDLATAVDSAFKVGATVISNSYGGGESGGYSFESHYNHPGSIILASAGDSGYGPQFPADSPHVVSVGGTRLSHATNKRGWTEVVWPGTGSGCSAVAPKPAWQTDTGCSNRTLNDVAADADPGSGVSVYDTYLFVHGWAVFGGTSVASPLVGGIYADAGNAKTLNYAQSLYTALAGQLYDVISGSNGTCSPAYLCTASPKYEYNGPTGNGTPHGEKAF